MEAVHGAQGAWDYMWVLVRDLGFEDLEVDRVDLDSGRVRRLDVLAHPGHLSQQEGKPQVSIRGLPPL